MPRPAKCQDSNCRSNRPITGSNYCPICKARNILKYNPKYSKRNYVFRGTYTNNELSNIIQNSKNKPYNITLFYCLSKIPREYLRIILEVPEKEDIEYYLRDHWEHDTKALRFNKHIIMWFRIYGKNYLFTPGQIKL